MRSLVPVAILITCSGCATFRDQAAVYPAFVVEAKAEYCEDLYRRYPEQGSGKIIAPLCDNFDLLENTGPAKTDHREYMINLMMVADRVCARELAALSADQRTVNAALSTTSTLLSAGATAIDGGVVDTILSSGATFLGSARDHINSEVYRAAKPEFVTILIQADREKIAQQNLNVESNPNISQQTAILMANRYHQSCSFYHGLALLSQAAGEKAEKLQEEAEDAKEGDGAGAGDDGSGDVDG